MPEMITLYCALCGDEFEREKAQWKYKIKNRNQENFYCTIDCTDLANSEKQSGTKNFNSKYDPNEIPHGTATGYKTRGCRCEKCVAYNSSRSNKNRKPEHGTIKRAQECTCSRCEKRLKKTEKIEVEVVTDPDFNPYIHFMSNYRDDYLWDRTDKISSAPCWIWTGATKKDSPCIRFRNGSKYHAFRVQRYLYANKIKNLMWMYNRYYYVGTTCENKLCVNPDHLKENNPGQN